MECHLLEDVGTELETLLYVLITVLSNGTLPWHHVALKNHNLPIRYGAIASEFSKTVLSYLC